MNLIKNRVNSVIDNSSISTIKPIFEDFHELIMNGNYEYPEHCHRNYEIIVVEDGPYLCRLNNVEIEVQSNHFLIIKPGDWHQDHLYDNQCHYVLHFTVKYETPAISGDINILKHDISPLDQLYRINRNSWDPISFFVNMKNNNNLNDAFTFNIQESLMETFFWNMIRCIPNENLSDDFLKVLSKQFFQERILRLFRTYYNKAITVDFMSRELNMSRRSLTYHCRHYFDDSPAKLFNKFKLHRALNLLKSEDFSVLEVSEILGFDNQFHFSRVFKRHFNISPSQFKNTL